MKNGHTVLGFYTGSRNHKRLLAALWASCCLHFFIIYGELIAIPKAAPPLQIKAMAITLKPLALNQPKLENTSIAANQPSAKVAHSASLVPKSLVPQSNPQKNRPKKTAQKNPNKSIKKIKKIEPQTLATTPSNMASQVQSSQETSQLDQTGMASDAFYLGDNTFVEGDLNKKSAANLEKKSSETVSTLEQKNLELPALGVKTDAEGFLVPTQTLDSLPNQLTLSITLMGFPGTIIWKQNQGSYEIEGRAFGKKALSTGRINSQQGLLPDDFLYLKNNSHFDYDNQQISYFYGGNPKTESFDSGAQDLLSLPFQLAFKGGQLTQLQLATGKKFNRYSISVEDKQIHIVKIHFDKLRTVKVSAKNDNGEKTYDVYLAVDFANMPVKIDSTETDDNGKKKQVSLLVQALKWGKTPLIEYQKKDYK